MKINHETFNELMCNCVRFGGVWRYEGCQHGVHWLFRLQKKKWIKSYFHHQIPSFSSFICQTLFPFSILQLISFLLIKGLTCEKCQDNSVLHACSENITNSANVKWNRMKNYAERNFNPLQQFWQRKVYISKNTCKRHKRYACSAKWLKRSFTLTTTVQWRKFSPTQWSLRN